MTGVDVASPTTSSDARSMASLSSTLFSSSTYAILEVQLFVSLSDIYWIDSIIYLVVRCILDWLDRFSCPMYLLGVPAVTSAACRLVLDNVEGRLKLYCIESLLLVSFLVVRFKNR